MNEENYSGKYFRTSYNDIKSSQNWLGKICLLGLISAIPVFGQMTVYGYSYEWAHKAAWGVDSPLPKKIYGRPNSKMLRWGWFAIVITFVIMLIPGIVSSIGSSLSSAGVGTTMYSYHGAMFNPGSAVLSGLGWLVSVVGLALMFFALFFIWVGIIRMTIYNQLGAGLQFGKIWAMMRQDFGGLLRIFGMLLIFECIGAAIIFIIVMGLLTAVLGATAAPLIMMLESDVYYDANVFMYLLSLLLVMLPVFLIVWYVTSCFEAFVQLLVARAVGYWTRQFDVSAWGSKDDPLPEITSNKQPSPQPQPPAGVATSQPAPPTGEPVATAASAATAAQPAPPSGEPVVAAPTGDPVVEATPMPPVSDSVEVPPAENPVDVAEALDAEPDLPAGEDKAE